MPPKKKRQSVCFDTKSAYASHVVSLEMESHLSLFECVEWLPKAGAYVNLVMLDLSINGFDFFQDIRIITRKVADPAKVAYRLLALSFTEAPARRFPHPQCTDQQTASRD